MASPVLCSPAPVSFAPTLRAALPSTTVTANLHSPVQHRVAVAAALAGLDVHIEHSSTSEHARVSSHGTVVEGATPAMMFLVRCAQSGAALDDLLEGRDASCDSGASSASSTLMPHSPSDFAAAQSIIAAADDLAAALTQRAAADVADIPAAKAAIDTAVHRLEALLSDDHPFALPGEHPTFADAAVVPVVARYLLVTMGAGLDALPRLWRLYETVCAVDAVAESLEEYAFDYDAFEAYAARRVTTALHC